MKKKLFPIATASALILTMSVPSFACTKCDNRKNDNGNHLGWHKSEIYEVVDGQFDNNGKHLGQFKEEWGSWVEPVQPEEPDVPEEDVEWFYYSIIDDVKGGNVSMGRDYASKGFYQIKYVPVSPEGMNFIGFMGDNGKIYQQGDSVAISDMTIDPYGEHHLTLTVMYEAVKEEGSDDTDDKDDISTEVVYDLELFWNRNKELNEVEGITPDESSVYTCVGLTKDELTALSINLKDRTTASRFSRMASIFYSTTNGVFNVEGYKILSTGNVVNTTDVITAEDFNFAPVYNSEKDEITENEDGEKIRIQHYTVREEIAPVFTLNGVLTTLYEARFNLEINYCLEGVGSGAIGDDMNTDGTTAQLGNLITFGVPEGIAKEGYTFLGYSYDFDATVPDFVYDYEEQQIVTPYLLTTADICQRKTLFIVLYPVYAKNAE